jgi:hypothetical protein
MRTTVLAALVLAAACGGKSPPSVGNVAGARPSGPAPAVGMEAGGDGDFGTTFTATGLPAIAADGKTVVYAVMGEDGARGAPNLSIAQVDRDDKLVHGVIVQRADDATMGDEGPPPPKDKLDEANRFLAETHASLGWIPLAPMEMVPVPGDEGNEDAFGSPKTGHAGDLVLSWDEGKVLVTQAGKTIVDRQTHGWTAPETVMCDGCEKCSNPSFLAGAWADPARKLILARISYTGNDTCWEPDSEDHVIAW